MTDLATTYLGLHLRTPIVPSPSPLMRNLDNLMQMEEAGAGAVVLHSLFEEEIERESNAVDYFLNFGTESYAEALSYLPEPSRYSIVSAMHYLDHIEQAKHALSIPVIASLNGVSPGGWVKYAKRIEEAGADALELNIYYLASNFNLSAEAVEQRYLSIMRDVVSSVNIPVAVKLGPYFSSLGYFARQIQQTGVQGLVMFNRFYQPDIDLEQLDVSPRVALSRSPELRLPLRWIAMLYGRVACDLALTSGVQTYLDVLKGIAAGADVVMVASELLRNGIERIEQMLTNMQEWLEERDYPSTALLQGSMSQLSCPDPSAFERSNYVQMVGTPLVDMPPFS